MDDEYVWLAGWYATRLHAVNVKYLEIMRDDFSKYKTEREPWIKSVCGAWVREEPKTEWAAKKIAKGIPKCKHCERMIKNTPTSKP